ncbi:MBL fold metallo-hydrolase RNA specificity domain-containing protein [Algoriphagus zhangzhouensis]|uniref:Metallo-beta-lactamase family protein n=1 Tax=Algoriphagus zhangzhouensis TaxID=1073327 RepID=A0A1M7ZDX1_9BACT|nr:MBL fold metallo-hydrolase [Algoriphagus zhangzhouensis]TDY45854.1 metallo-beta-lactamase family protein [Algoriphagus zhangzhouensis]SHO62999.1 metallo-beta-lactamase family protein [Algoriphagus zhangzhouensis]
MDVTVKFLGGAGSVTGSKYLIDLGEFEFLVDCGLFQGPRDLRERNWDKFPMPVDEMEAIVITHAHLDHIGYLPRLVKQGFRGPIYCTEPSAELAKILLMDSGKLQEEEAEYAKKKGYSRHDDPQPLYTMEDAEAVFPLLVPQPFETPFQIHPNITVTYYYAGHILGAAITKINIKGDQQEKKLVFSGDLGRFHDPVLYPPTLIPRADILWIESTYGDRISPPTKPEDELQKAILDVFDRDGLVIIPSFAVGRTQLIMYYLFQLMQKGKIPKVPIFLDSPMAINATKIYLDYAKDHQLSAVLEEQDQHPFNHSQLHYFQKQEQSKSLNEYRGRAIIISASGMATGGRVLHHLFHHLPQEKNGVIFVGYQAEGTRGRRLIEGEPNVRIYGLEVPVKAKIYQIDGLSAHADQSELMEWVDGFCEKPKKTFIIHGEGKGAEVLAQKLHEEYGWNTVIPHYLESFVLFEGI